MLHVRHLTEPIWIVKEWPSTSLLSLVSKHSTSLWLRVIGKGINQSHYTQYGLFYLYMSKALYLTLVVIEVVDGLGDQTVLLLLG
jgi:hypothetical protein